MENNYFQSKGKIVRILSLIYILIGIILLFIITIHFNFPIIYIIFAYVSVLLIIFGYNEFLFNYKNLQKINFEDMNFKINKNKLLLIRINENLKNNSKIYLIYKINEKRSTIILIDEENRKIVLKINELTKQFLYSIIPNEFLLNAILIYNNPILNNTPFILPDIYYIATNSKQKVKIIKEIKNRLKMNYDSAPVSEERMRTKR